MKNFFRSLALIPRGLKYKLIIVFCLMSIIPILSLLSIISNYTFTIFETAGNSIVMIVLSVFIAVLGFVLAGSIINPIIKMAKNARGLVNGQMVAEMSVENEDEIGDLGMSLNLLTTRLNKNMNELKSYEQKIREINMEINRKVMALSVLFQVGNIMSSAADLNIILQFIVDKAYELVRSEKAFLMLVDPLSNELVAKAVHNIKTGDMGAMRVRVGEGVLGKIFTDNRQLVVDASHKPPENLRNFLLKHDLKNIVIVPIVRRLRSIGLIACGNNVGNFSYQEDDIELLNIFAKQTSIAFENDVLFKKTEALSIKDDLTGLYNVNYLRTRLEEEIQRAINYQRPCSFILIDIDDFRNYYEKNGEVAAEAVLKKIAKILEDNVEQVDRVARFGDEEFAIICPEKNKMEALGIAESIRKEIEKFGFPHAESQPRKKITVSAGVAANPLDGITPDELIVKARERVDRAKAEGKNKIAV